MKEGLAVLIPAAGASRRYGQGAKQMLPWQDTTLLGHCIRKALSLDPMHCGVIIGAHHDEVSAACERSGATAYFAEAWPEGMGRSIAQGTELVLAAVPGITRMLLLLPDQPLVSTDHLQELCARSAASDHLVATAYPDGLAGAPAVIPRPWFNDLLQLSGDSGARNLLRSGPDKVLVACPASDLEEVDSPDDYQRLLGSAGS